MELPTYTSIWRIEKRLYKLYDFRLPMPLPVGQIAVFTAITVPYVILLTLFGANVLPARLALVGVRLGCALLAYVLARRLASPAFAAVPADAIALPEPNDRLVLERV